MRLCDRYVVVVCSLSPEDLRVVCRHKGAETYKIKIKDFKGTWKTTGPLDRKEG